ncbi:hypothetical protein ACHAP5_010839 [Fusarium lateritium]
MAFHNSSPTGTAETDSTYLALQTPAQRSLALKIKRYAGQFPWEIVPLCDETTWTQGLLDKFIELIAKSFSGQLSNLETRRLRSVLMNSVERKDPDKRHTLAQSDVAFALTEMKKSESQHDNKTPKSTRKKRVSSISKTTRGSAKRVRVEEESPPAAVTRSSKRLRGEASTHTPALSPETPVAKRNTRRSQAVEVVGDTDMEDNVAEVAQQDDDQTDEEPQDDPVDEDLQEPASQYDSPTEYHDVEESILDTAPTPTPVPDELDQPSARKIQVAELEMTDEEIGNRFRHNLSLIATRLQNARDRKLAELEAICDSASSVYEEACKTVDDQLARLEDLRFVHGRATENFEKARMKCENTAGAIKLLEEAETDGDSMAQVMAPLQQVLEKALESYQQAEADQDYAVEEMSKSLKTIEEGKESIDAANTKLEEAGKLRTMFKQDQLQKRKIKCTITMETDVQDDDGNLFGDLTFEFHAAVRQRGDDEDSE